MNTRYNTEKNGPKRAAAPKPGARHSLQPEGSSPRPNAQSLKPTASSLKPHPQSGAALILAIAIMTVLLAIALTFYTVSRAEVNNATNVRNRVQADLLVDSALAMVMAELNRDFLKHPNATSTDFKPFALFNGSWAAGKQWALRNGVPLQAGGVPLVNLTAMPDIGFPGGRVEQMFNGIQSQDWLYYPRIEGSAPYIYNPAATNLGGGAYTPVFFDINDPDRPPFVTPDYYGPGDLTANFIPDIYDGLPDVPQLYPLEWIHTWTDIDNDEDGLNDSIWIPIPQDRFFSGGEIIDDLTGRRMFDDGVDNDLDGMVDENQENNLNEDAVNEATPVPNDPDEAMELGVFVYYGGDDGLDNDGDGLIDEADSDESRVAPFYGLFLAAPLPGLTIPIDFNADGIVPDFVPDDTAPPGTLVPLTVTLPATITVQAPNDVGAIVNVSLGITRVDALDNDLDMLINDYQVYAYVGPNTNTGPPFVLRSFENPGITGGPPVVGIENISASNSVLPTGDPYYDVWRLTGNWAIGDADLFQTALLKSYDDINLDSAFGGGLDILPDSGTFYSEVSNADEPINYQALLPGLLRITHSGESVCDLAGRAAILVRDENSKVNVNVAGGHTLDVSTGDLNRSLGQGYSTSEYETRALPALAATSAANMWNKLTGYPADDSLLGAVDPGYNFDVRYPGYGRVDDNGNIFFAALNGIDDDGDGLIDEGLYLPPLGDPLFATYYALLGDFEGNDDPGELQRYRPLPNLLAEGREPFRITATVDDIDNDIDGAAGERGEFGDLQLQDTLQLRDVIPGAHSDLKQSLSAFGTDRNVNFVATDSGIRAVNKLDYNFATPQQIAANLLIANPLQTVTATPVTGNPATNAFAAGLLQGDVHIRSTYDPPAGLVSGLLWQDPDTTGPAPFEPTSEVFPADPVLQAMQAAVDIVDFRDPGHSRSALTTERQKATPQTALEAALYDTWPNRLSLRERIPEEEYFALEEIQEHLSDVMGIQRKIEFVDEWWSIEAGVAGESGALDPNGNRQTEKRTISYTASGNESIKINELMVRPVRRIEAETIAGVVGPTDPMVDALVPTNFDPSGGLAALPGFNVERATAVTIADQGWELVDGGVLGDRSYIGIGIDATGANPASVQNARDDVLEFAILQSEGLPPGRYYLTVNTENLLGPTVLPAGTVVPAGTAPMLDVAVKYVNVPLGVPFSNSIIADGGAAPFIPVPDAHIGSSVLGAPDGWLFVDGTQGGVGNATGYHLDGLPEEIPGGGLPIIRSTQPTTVPTTLETFTITVPDTAAGSAFVLHIAFQVNELFIDELVALGATGVPVEIAINSLDFSQEPDHEWVELVNVSDQPVNVGGWHLEVGIPERGDDVPPDAFRSRWRIPPGTVVAPDGMLLLGFDKFDHFQRDFSLIDTGLLPYPGHLIAENGMGLARTDNEFLIPSVDGFLSYTESLTNRGVTVPPIGDISPSIAFGATLFDYRDVTGSVFYRNVDYGRTLFTDYIDRDGDGVSSAYQNFFADTDNAALEQNTISTTDGQDPGFFNANNGGVAMGARPWDRIVQLENLQLGSVDHLGATPVNFALREVQDVADVAALVLRGGVLPNYPERDGIDNDGDGAYVRIEPDGSGAVVDTFVDPFYVPGTLDRDMVDNDGDGLIDERGEMLWADGVEDFDFIGIPDAAFGDGVNPLLSEGVDEGRGGLAGAFSEVLLPIQFFNDRFLYPEAAYTNFSRTNITSPYLTMTDDGAGGFVNPTGIDALAFLGAEVTQADPSLPALAYLGSNNDPPDWKAFTERRWYPGDNVIVTLYEGDASEGQVADRVTYRELDVTNRTIDDVATVPYIAVDVDNPADGIQRDEVPQLNTNYPTFWLPDHMALDFYRSLERKHPLYNGDRFGTTNRWEATDGNYDDWADSLSYFEAELETGLVGPPDSPLTLSNNSVVDPRARFTTLTPELAFRQERLYRHAMAGTPLRMNSAARRTENPRDLEGVLDPAVAPYNGDPRQFPNPLEWYRTHEDGLFGAPGSSPESLRDQGWNHGKAFVANRRFTNPGDLMNVPHQTFLHDAVNTAAVGGSVYLRDMSLVNYNVQGGTALNDNFSLVQPVALRGATLGQDAYTNATFGNLLTAAVESMALESAVLTVGQAEFRPIRPDLGPIAAADRPGVVDWIINPQSTSGGMYAPASWAPVFLFPLPDDGGITDVERFPYYPTNVDGSNFAVQMRPDYLFNGGYMENNQPLAFLGTTAWTAPDHPYRDRWPLERRSTMYVSEVRPGIVGTDRPEGLFIWDGEDGLENGEYELYVGTFIPGLQERALEAAGYSAGFNVNVPAKPTPLLLYGNAGDDVNLANLQVDRVTREILAASQADSASTRTLFDPEFALDVITDPSEARGVAPRIGVADDPSQKPGGLIHPDDWNPAIRYRAGDDGYMFFGNNAAGGWKPQIVTVTDNFLALRVRNVGEPGQIGVITHVVLAPRKRTPGRVNINTTTGRKVQRGNSHEYLNVAMGLPGIVDAGLSVVPSENLNGAAIRGPYLAADSISVMNFGQPALAPWAAPSDYLTEFTYDGSTYDGSPAIYVPPLRNRHDSDPPASPLDPPGNDRHLLVPPGLTDGDDSDGGEELHRVAAYRLTQLMEIGRLERPDGRYYDAIGDLVSETSGYTYNYGTGRPELPDRTAINPGELNGADNRAVYPLSNESTAAKRFDEAQARFRRLGNLVTTRSDIYEITMTVEAGYGTDRDGDGFINYRSADEFVTTARTKATAVYERRTPTGQAAGEE